VSTPERLLYLDASALVKLIAQERESLALLAYLSRQAGRVSSALTRVEVMRTLGRSTLGAAGRRRAEEVLAGVAFIRLHDGILDAAGDLLPTGLRSLDALHLATALSIAPDLAGFVTYDRRLADAAASAGLNVVTPE
jgi:hypothetical protein